MISQNIHEDLESSDDFAHRATEIGHHQYPNPLSCSEGDKAMSITGVQCYLDAVTVEGNCESSDDFAIMNARHVT